MHQPASVVQRRVIPLCQLCQDLVLTSVTTEVQTYHIHRTGLVWQWHMDFPLLVSQAEGVIT